MKRKITLVFMILMLITIVVPTYAKSNIPENGKYSDAQGHIYIMKNGKPRTGHFKYKGKWYYGHKTSTKKYPKGSCTAGEMRIEKGDKWYAYKYDGTMYTKDVYVRKGRFKKYLSVDIRSRNHTVRYVYNTTRKGLGYRYSTKEKRMQYWKNGKWKTIEGMQFIPDYVDTQR